MMSLPFLPVEYENRLERIRVKMRSQEISALILTRPENIFYTTGFRAAHIANRTAELAAVVVPLSSAPRLITRALEAETVKAQWTTSPHLYKDHESAYEALRIVLAECGEAKGALGVEAGALKLRQFWNFQRCLLGATFKDVSGLVESVAAYPSPAEIDCMHAAGRIADIGLSAGVASVRDGVFPYEIVGRVHEAMYGAGQSDFDRSLVAVWSGPRGGRMHDTLTTDRIRQDDSVTIEVMGVNNHYRAGAQSTVFVGDRPSVSFAEAYDLVSMMHDAARSTIKAGIRAGEVFEAANSVYRPRRGSDYYRRCGGSMGLTQFSIDLVKGGTALLNSGVSLLIQTLVDDPILIACASTVLVTENGCIGLTAPDTRRSKN